MTAFTSPPPSPSPFEVWASNPVVPCGQARKLLSLWSDLLWFGFHDQTASTVHYCRLTGFLLCLRTNGTISGEQHRAMLEYAAATIQRWGLVVPNIPATRDELETF